jgi:hypothetical protein
MGRPLTSPPLKVRVAPTRAHGRSPVGGVGRDRIEVVFLARISADESTDGCISVDGIVRLPGVFTAWVTLPLDEILHPTPAYSRVKDLFNLVMAFTINNHRRWGTGWTTARDWVSWCCSEFDY